jgi:hypothetical protein
VRIFAAIIAALALISPANAAYLPWPPSWTPVLENGLSTTVQTVDSSAGSLGYYYCYNPNTTVAYIQIFDTSGTVTLGTTTPKLSIGIPGTAGGNLEWANGVSFANAIKVAATTTATGSTAPSTAIDCNFGYR